MAPTASIRRDPSTITTRRAQTNFGCSTEVTTKNNYFLVEFLGRPGIVSSDDLAVVSSTFQQAYIHTPPLFVVFFHWPLPPSLQHFARERLSKECEELQRVVADS